MDLNRRILPYYMTYPGPYGTRQEDTVIRDLEYLQQIYPAQVRRYQRRIADILDKVDYEGSMIYDEYPDSCCIRYLTKSMVDVLSRERREEEPENPMTPEQLLWLENLVQVLLTNEIYKRRHGGKKGFIKF